MIVGTAGHIDHGKTTLVKALTGVDTDRLKEEKERGISIELGYAYVPLGDATTNGDAPEEMLGFVDVPGHERLIHTMVAGATGIDFALLVIAADDGVMPQTREHVAILDVLGLTLGAVALTKTDRVDAARVQAARTEIAALLASTPLRDAPLFAVAATNPDDPGVADLRAHLLAAARRLQRHADDGLFRLAVDRVFTLAGHGTVAAGMVTSGAVHVGDTVHVMPAGIAARVRSIHAQNRAAAVGRAGQRCALNLVQVDKAAVARGDWLADPRALAPTTRIDADLRLFDDAPRLVQWSLLHLHFGTTHRTARAVLLDTEHLAAGERGRVQFVFDAPVCATSGDRYVVRDAQAAYTLGGGVLLDPYAPARKRRSPERLRRLDALARMVAGEGIEPLLDDAAYGMDESELMRLAGMPFETLSLPHEVRVLGSEPARVAILDRHWLALRARTLDALREFHARTPDESGPDSARLRRIVARPLSLTAWRTLVDELLRDGAVTHKGPWLHLPDHVVALSAQERALADTVLPLIAAAGFDPPWTRDLARSANANEEAMRRTLRKLAAEGELAQVVPDLFYARETVAVLAALAAEIAARSGKLEIAAYRDRLGIGRKRAMQILEFFDRTGYTRRQRDARILRSDSGWKDTLPASPRTQGTLEKN